MTPFNRSVGDINRHVILISFFQADTLKIVQSNEPKIVQMYLEDYLILLQNRMNQYAVEITTQSVSCPVGFLTKTGMSLEMLDAALNDFVRLHHLHLKREVNYQISRLRDAIRVKELDEESSLYPITSEQVTSRCVNFSRTFCFVFRF